MKARIVFLHGGPAYDDYLEGFFAGQFPEYDCVFYTQLKHDSVSIEELLEQLEDKIRYEPCFLVGHSFGGAVALEYLRLSQDPRVRGLVLISSIVSVADALEHKTELASLGLSKPTPEQIFLTPDEDLLAGDLLPRLQKSFNLRAFMSLNEFFKTYDASSYVRTAHIPILNIFGEKDIRIPARRIRAYADLSPRVHNIELRNTAHFPFIKMHDLETCVSAIEKFIATTLES